MKLYDYISPTKADLLYKQLTATTMVEQTTEIGASITVPVANVSSKFAAKETKPVSVFEKLELIKKEVEKKALVGNIKQNNMFIFDNIILAPAFGHGVATWRGALFDRKKKVLYRYLMYGSQKNLQVYGDGFLPKVPIAGSSKEEFFYALYEACKCSLDKDEEINEAVYKEHKNLRYLYCDLASLKLNEWQLIEWFFYDREVGTSFSTGTSFYEFLARADYRQTITRDYYEEYVQNSKYFKQYFKKGHRAGLRNPYWHVPDETEAIVYVYGSPIFVEKKPLSQLVHNINDRSYLYLSKKDIQKLRSYTLNNVSFLRLISKALIENGLIKEEQSMRNELLFEDEANKMKDQELMEYVSKYVTNVKPL